MAQRREQSGLAFLSEPVALSPDVEHMAVVQQPVQDGRSDDGVAEQLPPTLRTPCLKSG